MKQQHRYSASDKMSALICDNYSLLLVMSRFGLSLGFGDETVRDVCSKQGVDCNTFLAVVNFIAEERDSIELTDDFSVASLMGYLKQAHTYFLDFKFPSIRQKLVNAIDCSVDNQLAFLILRFFDEYVSEVRSHMDYEDKHVFKYTMSLLDGKLEDVKFNIGAFAKKHERAESKLTELKNIIIKYYPQKTNNNLLNDVLYDIYNCEADLSLHTKIEDYMFVPAVAGLEEKLRNEI